MTGPLEMIGPVDAESVCVDGVCAVPGTASAPPAPEAADGADGA